VSVIGPFTFLLTRWPILRYYPSIYLAGVSETIKNITLAGLQTKIQTTRIFQIQSCNAVT